MCRTWRRRWRPPWQPAPPPTSSARSPPPPSRFPACSSSSTAAPSPGEKHHYFQIRCSIPWQIRSTFFKTFCSIGLTPDKLGELSAKTAGEEDEDSPAAAESGLLWSIFNIISSLPHYLDLKKAQDNRNKTEICVSTSGNSPAIREVAFEISAGCLGVVHRRRRFGDLQHHHLAKK